MKKLLRWVSLIVYALSLIGLVVVPFAALWFFAVWDTDALRVCVAVWVACGLVASLAYSVFEETVDES